MASNIIRKYGTPYFSSNGDEWRINANNRAISFGCGAVRVTKGQLNSLIAIQETENEIEKLINRMNKLEALNTKRKSTLKNIEYNIHTNTSFDMYDTPVTTLRALLRMIK